MIANTGTDLGGVERGVETGDQTSSQQLEEPMPEDTVAVNGITMSAHVSPAAPARKSNAGKRGRGRRKKRVTRVLQQVSSSEEEAESEK